MLFFFLSYCYWKKKTWNLKPETLLFNPLFLQSFVDSIFEWLLISLVIDSLFSVSQNSPTFDFQPDYEMLSPKSL